MTFLFKVDLYDSRIVYRIVLQGDAQPPVTLIPESGSEYRTWLALDKPMVEMTDYRIGTTRKYYGTDATDILEWY